MHQMCRGHSSKFISSDSNGFLAKAKVDSSPVETHHPWGSVGKGPVAAPAAEAAPTVTNIAL